jgi:hypothetical protein
VFHNRIESDHAIQQLRSHGINIDLHQVDFDQVVSKHRKVWGYSGKEAFIEKLSLACELF